MTTINTNRIIDINSDNGIIAVVEPGGGCRMYAVDDMVTMIWQRSSTGEVLLDAAKPEYVQAVVDFLTM
jgi:hypothetical protein